MQNFFKKYNPEKETGLMRKYLLDKAISEPDVKSVVETESWCFIQY